MRMLTVALTVALVSVSVSGPAAGSPSASERAKADPDAPVTFVIGLPINEADLTREARVVASPGSSRFRNYLTVGEAAARFGASPQATARFERRIAQLGLSSAVDPTGLFARVTAPVATWERVMGEAVTFNPASAGSAQIDPLGPFDTFIFQTQGEMAGVPPALAGVATAIIPRYQAYLPAYDVAGPPPAQPAAAAATTTRILDYPGKGSAALPTNAGMPLGPNCLDADQQKANFTPYQVSRAYGLDRLQERYGRSAGQRLAIISLGGGFLQSDVDAGAACFGHSSPRVDVRTGVGMSAPFVSVGGETTLDLQTVAWALGSATSVRLVQVPLLGAGLIDAFALALTGWPKPPETISTSFGLCESVNPASAASIIGSTNLLENLFRFAAVIGTTAVFAAGDTGSSPCQLSGQAAGDTQQAAAAQSTVFYPASSPFVTAVGGSQLTLGAANTRVAETVWNDLQYALPSAASNLVGGGGPSQIFRAPWYQGPITPASMRTVPDIAVQAGIGPGLPLFFGGTLLSSVGGTSQASPIAASGLALLSAQQRASGRPPLGFANPWLYQVVRASPSVVYDITAGDNQYPVSYAPGSVNVPACCQAAPGYDTASGLGAPLFDRLASTPVKASPSRR